MSTNSFAINNSADDISSEVQGYLKTPTLWCQKWPVPQKNQKCVQFSLRATEDFFGGKRVFVFISPKLSNTVINKLIGLLKDRQVTCGFNSDDDNIYSYERVLLVDPNEDYPELLKGLEDARIDHYRCSKENLKDELDQNWDSTNE